MTMTSSSCCCDTANTTILDDDDDCGDVHQQQKTSTRSSTSVVGTTLLLFGGRDEGNDDYFYFYSETLELDNGTNPMAEAEPEIEPEPDRGMSSPRMTNLSTIDTVKPPSMTTATDRQDGRMSPLPPSSSFNTRTDHRNRILSRRRIIIRRRRKTRHLFAPNLAVGLTAMLFCVFISWQYDYESDLHFRGSNNNSSSSSVAGLVCFALTFRGRRRQQTSLSPNTKSTLTTTTTTTTNSKHPTSTTTRSSPSSSSSSSLYSSPLFTPPSRMGQGGGGIFNYWRRNSRSSGSAPEASASNSFSRLGSGTKRKRRHHNLWSKQRSRPSSALQMVLTTPESIIEQASTINLLDDLIDESVRTSARRPIMMQFDPSSGWIWRRWSGTIFAETWTSCVRNMAWALIIFFLHRSYPNVLNEHLAGFGTLWGQLLSITTFTLTFFVNQSYSLWRKCMELSRRLQGRLHDIGMNMATHAERKVPTNPSEKATYTSSSRQILELMSRYVRVFNLLTYASFTRSHRPILTPRGMRRLVERGLMTAQEREVLVDAGIPATQRHSVVLMWMIRLFVEGRESGHIQGGAGFESETMHKFHIIRSQYGAIGDELQGRMPLAYAHIVQVLVDVILWMFPIMAFSSGMSPLLVILGSGLLTVSYQGLFDLAKQFLDPYDNENYGRGDDPLCVDTLIAETNAGSVRWLYGFEEMPYSSQRVKDGELYEYLLPVRGYTVEDLVQMEEERIERERQMEEQRRREELEEAERLRKEAEETESMDVDAVDNEEDMDSPDEILDIPALPDDVNATAVSVSVEKRTTALDNTTIVESVKTVAVQAADTEDLNATVAEITTQSETTVVPEDSQSTTPAKEERTVHKVITLKTGKPVSLRDTEVVKAPKTEPVPTNMQTSNYLATLGPNNGDGSSSSPESVDSGPFVPEMVDYEMFQDLPWFDEVGPDGQELRLSQQLADEEPWEDLDDGVETKTMTWDEYQERVKELQENAEKEARETIEILSAVPGAGDDGSLYTVKEKRREKKDSPTYDQTRMDGISQLWGLPPEDPSDLEEYETPEKIDDLEFDGISQLWGGQTSAETREKRPDDDDEVVGMTSFSGITELWGTNVEDTPNDRGEADEIDEEAGETNGDNGEPQIKDGQDTSFAGLPWHDENGPDGQEYRLSQMLADEEWEALEADQDDTAPMTFEEYQEEVEKMKEQVEEELRETEAILMSRPGDDPVGWDYDDELLTPMSTEAEDEEEQEEEITEEDLEALGMDEGVDDDQITVDDDSLLSANGEDTTDEDPMDVPKDNESEKEDSIQSQEEIFDNANINYEPEPEPDSEIKETGSTTDPRSKEEENLGFSDGEPIDKLGSASDDEEKSVDDDDDDEEEEAIEKSKNENEEEESSDNDVIQPIFLEEVEDQGEQGSSDLAAGDADDEPDSES